MIEESNKILSLKEMKNFPQNIFRSKKSLAIAFQSITTLCLILVTLNIQGSSKPMINWSSSNINPPIVEEPVYIEPVKDSTESIVKTIPPTNPINPTLTKNDLKAIKATALTATAVITATAIASGIAVMTTSPITVPISIGILGFIALKNIFVSNFL